jgi:Protein of unknown function (DUF3606)
MNSRFARFSRCGLFQAKRNVSEFEEPTAERRPAHTIIPSSFSGWTLEAIPPVASRSIAMEALSWQNKAHEAYYRPAPFKFNSHKISFSVAPMADDKTNCGPQDRSRVSLQEPYEVEYWTKKFAVSKAELGVLVMKHGNSVKKIEEALKK